ncbi:PHB depolymerase family esterase [Lutibacter sp.]|uniref:extracellular catalytic domain type 1 short-chain-length polyhydroxyalkanoate depolymerase n=1 Tax=Lutibacter sp. TaxID=1925666 RepID=UPI003569C3B0
MIEKFQNIIGLILLLTSFQLISQNNLVEITDFGANKGNLEMYVYKPINNDMEVPLVIVLHGCVQTANEIADQSGWSTLAASNNFMVIYPQQKVENNLNKCFNWYENTDISKKDGESETIKEMIQYAIQNFDIDTSKIFITGISAGGAMTNILLANYPDLFKSGSVLAGIPFQAANDLATAYAAMQGNVEKTNEEWVAAISENNPNYDGKYPEVVIFHGIDDPFVNIKNAEIIEMQWKGIHKIVTKPIIVSEFNGNRDITKTTYFKNNCPIIVKYEINNLGHAMAVDPGTEKQQGGNVARFALDKNFHSTYWTAKFFGLIND